MRIRKSNELQKYIENSPETHTTMKFDFKYFFFLYFPIFRIEKNIDVY